MPTRTTIPTALARLSVESGRRGEIGEINVVGGSAMVPAFNVSAAAETVGQESYLPPGWLNDAVKGFMSSIDRPNLRVPAPTPEYMPAMKVPAARSSTGNDRGDAANIAFLIRIRDLRSAEAVMDLADEIIEGINTL